MESKRAAAERAADEIVDGMTVGLGTGSTAYWAILKIAQRIKEGLTLKAIATSQKSEQLAMEQDIPVFSFAQLSHIDITIDGADEVDENLNLIKGGGGALLREKIVASSSQRLLIVVDESKLVPRLGKFALPVEVVPFGIEMTQRKIDRLGCTSILRSVAGKPFVTDNGNYILDCPFGFIDDAERIHRELNLIPGVVDNGLFIHMAHEIYVGQSDGRVRKLVAGKN